MSFEDFFWISSIIEVSATYEIELLLLICLITALGLPKLQPINKIINYEIKTNV
jgi:hypothetical protein